MHAIVCLMLDTQTKPEGITADTPEGPFPRFSSAAIERAQALLGISDLDSLGSALGFSRMNFWRARVGKHDIRYSHARRIADQLGMPLDEIFDGGTDA
jgi:hypothetical protein